MPLDTPATEKHINYLSLFLSMPLLILSTLEVTSEPASLQIKQTQYNHRKYNQSIAQKDIYRYSKQRLIMRLFEKLFIWKQSAQQIWPHPNGTWVARHDGTRTVQSQHYIFLLYMITSFLPFSLKTVKSFHHSHFDQEISDKIINDFWSLGNLLLRNQTTFLGLKQKKIGIRKRRELNYVLK